MVMGLQAKQHFPQEAKYYNIMVAITQNDWLVEMNLLCETQVSASMITGLEKDQNYIKHKMTYLVLLC